MAVQSREEERGPDQQRMKGRAASLSVGYNLSVTVLKFFAAVITGSVSLLSEAIHSATDIVSSVVALISVRAAALPPDDEHPFGHGKIESLTGFAEGILLFVVVVYIDVEAVQRLIAHERLPKGNLPFGLLVMGISAFGSLVVSRYVLATARRTESTALFSNGQHLGVDFLTSAGVFAGLLVTKLTGWPAADPLIAIVLAFWIAFGAWKLVRRAFDELIDIRLPQSELDLISELLNNEPRVLSHHRLRTRRSGIVRNIDLHIVVPREWSVVQAHELADDLEKTIRHRLSPAEVVIHVDPFDPGKAR